MLSLPSDADHAARAVAARQAATLVALTASHPQRFLLNDEVHARPPEALSAPMRLSYVALLIEGEARGQAWEAVAALVRRFGADPPAPDASHFSADLGPFRLKWERHTEFVRYSFMVPGLPAGEDPFAHPAIAALPAEWVSALPGQVIMAAHVALARADGLAPADPEAVSARLFGGNPLVGAAVAGGAATALTDFRIHADGFSRILVYDGGMAPRQAGRMVQRLLEIDTYRVMALLALPVARELTPFLAERERELARITAALVSAGEQDEKVLLDRLTRLEAEIENRQSGNLYRFSAAAAYYDLVRARIEELREERLEGMQTFREFTERRLAPAMNTCRSVAARQESLSRRLARATQLLSTRVDVTRAGQTQAVLESMNRRARMQLHLQSTVEGLSIAAVTYYVVGLVGYAAKGAKAAGLGLDPELLEALSIPFVAAVVAYGLHRVRRAVTRA